MERVGSCTFYVDSILKQIMDRLLRSLVPRERGKALFCIQLEHYGKDFISFECPQNFALLSEEWGIDNGLLTPTLKLKREVVEDQFRSQIESLYS